jgi:hypothetical protein
MYRKHCVRMGRRARGGNSDNTEAAAQHIIADATNAEDAAPHEPETETARAEAPGCARPAP